MQAFNSIPKKLALPAFVLFEIGWIVYTVGFSLLLVNFVRGTNRSVYSPFYFTLAGGQFVVVLGLAHAGLPSGLSSSIVHVLSTILDTIYFVFTGYVLVYSRLLLPSLLQFTAESNLLRSVNLVFAGTILLTVSWSLVQLLTVFYEQPQPQQTRSWWHLIVDSYKALFHASELNGPSHQITCSEAVRLSSIPAIIFSAVGWGVLVSGMHNDESGLFHTSICSISTPINCYFSIIMVCCFHHPSSLLGRSAPCWMFRRSQHHNGSLYFHLQHILHCL